MSRSAADATRFTATGPYANSKPGSTAAPSSRLPYNLPSFMTQDKKNNPPKNPQSQNEVPQGEAQGGPSGRKETARERVDRLRAQTRAARMAQGSATGVDRMIEVGRRVANRAHKTMVYALIATSGVCGILTVYSMISLTLYNRRQRAVWLDNELEKLQQARLAFANDSASAEQMELLRNEKVGEIIREKREAEKQSKPWNRAKQFLFGGLKMDGAEQGGDQGQGEGQGERPGVLEAVNAKAVEDKTANATPAGVAGPQPGQLDVLGENAEAAVKEGTRSWKSWFTWR